MLSDEQIDAIDKRTLGPHYFARAIEAEVRKQDEALIRQLVEIMESTSVGCYNFHHSKQDRHGATDSCPPTAKFYAALAAGRARLESKP